jgi:hypothetical protein
MAAITVEIGGIDRTSYVGAGTVSIDAAINGKYSLSAILRPNTTGYRPTRGNTFVVYEDGTKRFAGNIFSMIERDASGSQGIMEYSIRCVDYNHAANRRRYAGEFVGPQSLSTILDAILSVGLSGEGITRAALPSDPSITQTLTFKYETVASCLNKLTAITGFLWYIDFDKVLRCSPFTSTAAPIAVTDANDTWPDGWRDLEVERSDEDKRNRQYVRTESSLGLIYDETYTITQANSVMFPTTSGPTEMISITVNGSPATVTSFVPGETPPNTYDFYWSDTWMGLFTYGGIVGDPSQGLQLNIGDVIAYSYRGAGRNVVMVEDQDDQALRASIEGGSGIWEAIEEQRHITNISALTAIANGRLAQNGRDSIRARFETDASGMAPAQRITVTVPRWDIDQELLIERVNSTWIAASDDFFRHKVTCVGLDLYSQSPETSPEGTTYIEPVAQPESYMERVVEMARIGETPAQLVEEAEVQDGSSSGPMLNLWFEDPELAADDVSRHYPELSIGADRYWVPTLWHANVVTPPVGGSPSPSTDALQFKVWYSTDDGATWTEMFEGTIEDGDRANDGDMADFSPPVDLQLSDGTLFKATITQVGLTTPGGGLHIQVEGDLV